MLDWISWERVGSEVREVCQRRWGKVVGPLGDGVLSEE